MYQLKTFVPGGEKATMKNNQIYTSLTSLLKSKRIPEKRLKFYLYWISRYIAFSKDLSDRENTVANFLRLVT